MSNSGRGKLGHGETDFKQKESHEGAKKAIAGLLWEDEKGSWSDELREEGYCGEEWFHHYLYNMLIDSALIQCFPTFFESPIIYF